MLIFVGVANAAWFTWNARYNPDTGSISYYNYIIWQVFLAELLLFPQAEHDDLFDDLQTMVEGAL